MKNRLHRYDIDQPRPRHGHNYIICKMYFNLMVTIYSIYSTSIYSTPKDFDKKYFMEKKLSRQLPS